MARRTLVRLVDGLDSTDIAEGEGETVAFALDGIQYEIDLTQENAGDEATGPPKRSRAPRAPTRVSPGVPQPHQLHGRSLLETGRLQTPTTPFNCD